jgi:hypothetical protein
VLGEQGMEVRRVVVTDVDLDHQAVERTDSGSWLVGPLPGPGPAADSCATVGRVVSGFRCVLSAAIIAL